MDQDMKDGVNYTCRTKNIVKKKKERERLMIGVHSFLRWKKD